MPIINFKPMESRKKSSKGLHSCPTYIYPHRSATPQQPSFLCEVDLESCRMHLALSWLPTLERILLEVKPEEVHDDFRLFLTSEPTPAFPVSILQSGIKMTNEPPKGLRANLMRSYLGFTDAQLNKSKNPKAFKKLLFALCFFHAVILDRRRFGALGWNIQYQFQETDLNVCITQLRDFIDMYAEIPYRTLHFLTYDINYGGRVTDDVDRRTICTILDDFINEAVLADDYSFTPSGKYLSIPTGTREHYLQHIAMMDSNPEPEVFGMHENADITSAQEDTNVLFTTILALLPRSTVGSGKSREQIIIETSTSILDRTPQPWEVESVQKRYPTLYTESMNTVLVQEAIRYNRLLSTMRSTLEDLGKALKGEMVMTEALEGMATSLFNNQVPDLWVAVAYPSLMPLSAWVADLLNRHSFIDNWIENSIPCVFWISGFFFPQSVE
jgi:dynein heavy chain